VTLNDNDDDDDFYDKPQIITTFDLLTCFISGVNSPTTDGSLPHKLSYDYNIGRSLLASYCSHYMSDFVLHGTNERSMLTTPYLDIHRDLRTSVQVAYQ